MTGTYSPLFREMVRKAFAAKLEKHRREVEKRRRKADPVAYERSVAEHQMLVAEQERLIAEYEKYYDDCAQAGIRPISPKDFFKT
ncbi:hypothetical protein FRB90_007090, partial [Tulasnella sp. 427]